jgi:hypothetical protein
MCVYHDTLVAGNYRMIPIIVEDSISELKKQRATKKALFQAISYS